MKLEEYLSSNNLTQLKFSASAGISNVHLGRLIKGRHLPSIPMIKKIEKATNGKVTINDFLREKVDERTKS